jgi:hypothetical protein
MEAIEAVRQWATGHGGYPPHTADFASDPTLPSRTYVLRHFGGLASLRQIFPLPFSRIPLKIKRLVHFTR